jgi:lysophospholipase L1-like esterase
VDTLVPIDPVALSARYYQPDELHLNSEGAELFTSALAAFLPKSVDHEPLASPN